MWGGPWVRGGHLDRCREQTTARDRELYRCNCNCIVFQMNCVRIGCCCGIQLELAKGRLGQYRAGCSRRLLTSRGDALHRASALATRTSWNLMMDLQGKICIVFV
jgi:hypothetical protein